MTQSTNTTDQLYVVTCERKSNDSRFQASKPITRKRAEAFLADHRYSGGDDNPKSPFKNYRIEEYHGETDDGPILKPVETWHFTASIIEGASSKTVVDFERDLVHDEDLGTPFEQADLLCRGLHDKHRKANVSAQCKGSNSFISLPTFWDNIDNEIFLYENRKRPIELSGVDQTDVNFRIHRALRSRHGETDETNEKAKEITSRIIHRERGDDEPNEGEFTIEVDGHMYRFEWERYDDTDTNFLSAGNPNVWFDIQAELWPPKCPDCDSKLKHDGINDPMCKEWFICEVCDERWVRSRGIGEELDQAV